MYCENCKKQISDDSLFCPYCGNKPKKLNICDKCGKEIPEDSDFCPFCGSSVSKNFSSSNTDKKVTPVNKAESKKNVISKSSPKFVFSIEEPKSKQKLSKPAVAAISALSIICAILLSLNVFQYVHIVKENEETANLIQVKDNIINNYEKERYSKGYRYDDYYSLLKDSNFLHNKIAIVYDDEDNYYHEYGCAHHNSDEFWAFNTEAAINRGFEPCPYCQK